MGITGLLPLLKKIQRTVHISSFRGKRVAVDAYCWLHRGAYSCAMQLVLKTGNVETLPFIKYCMKRINLLRQYDISPILVFDGGRVPMKAGTEKDRRERRDQYLQKGKALLKEGKKTEAFNCFQSCVDITPEMALALIKECRKEGVEHIVAPYEADAQMAYLQKEGLVELVITEDSDLLAFGCQKVLFKLDEAGTGQLIELKDIGKANDRLVGFTPDSFRQVCILSGCDYLPSIPGIGLITAAKLMRKFNYDPYRVIKAQKYETSKVPSGYEQGFKQAENTFLYQLVFDTRSMKQVPLNPISADLDPKELDFAGIKCSPRKAVGMARGNINPITHEVMDSYSPSKAAAPLPKSHSWNGQAFRKVSESSSERWPLGSQTNMNSFTSSEKSKQKFKPPRKVCVAPEDDPSLGDEELQSLYSSSTASGDEPLPAEEPSKRSLLSALSKQPKEAVVTFSRYFGKPKPQPSSSEGLLSEDDDDDDDDDEDIKRADTEGSKIECGSISLESGCGSMSLESGCGSTVETSGCGSMSLESGCGSTVETSGCGSMSLESGCGSTLEGCSTEDAATVSMSVEMENEPVLDHGPELLLENDAEPMSVDETMCSMLEESGGQENRESVDCSVVPESPMKARAQGSAKEQCATATIVPEEVVPRKRLSLSRLSEFTYSKSKRVKQKTAPAKQFSTFSAASLSSASSKQEKGSVSSSLEHHPKLQPYSPENTSMALMDSRKKGLALNPDREVVVNERVPGSSHHQDSHPPPPPTTPSNSAKRFLASEDFITPLNHHHCDDEDDGAGPGSSSMFVGAGGASSTGTATHLLTVDGATDPTGSCADQHLGTSSGDKPSGRRLSSQPLFLSNTPQSLSTKKAKVRTGLGRRNSRPKSDPPRPSSSRTPNARQTSLFESLSQFQYTGKPRMQI